MNMDLGAPTEMRIQHTVVSLAYIGCAVSLTETIPYFETKYGSIRVNISVTNVVVHFISTRHTLGACAITA